MLDEVILESRHKFVYFDEDYRDIFVHASSMYPAKMDSDKPIAVYVYDEGIPSMDNKLGLDRYTILSFHNNYYSLLIVLAIMNTLIEQVDRNILNERLSRLFKQYSKIYHKEIDDIVAFGDMLFESKNIYKEAYLNYMKTGELNFYDKLAIPFVIVDFFIPSLKEEIGLKKNFQMLFDLKDNLSVYNLMAVNSYIGSRCNAYLSVNVLCGDNDWQYYHDANGQFIQYIHDYTIIDERKKNVKRRKYT